MALGLEITFDESGEFQRFSEKLTEKNIARAQEAAMREAAKAATRIVQDCYDNAEDLRTPGTMEVYRQGKLASKTGGTRERNAYPSARSMVRTGQLKKGVTYKIEGRGADVSFRIEVRPGDLHNKGDWDDYNKPLAMLAAQLEEPAAVIVPLTQRMNAFLHALADGTAGQPGSGRAPAGSGSGAAPDETVGKGYVLVTPRTRGVWKRAESRMGEIEAPFALSWKLYFDKE